MTETNLQGKIGFITGRGHRHMRGEASVRLLMAAGGNAVIVDVNAARATAVIETLPVGSVIFSRTNVADEASAMAVVDAAIKAFGHIDIVVNLAGITSLVGPVPVDGVKGQGAPLVAQPALHFHPSQAVQRA